MILRRSYLPQWLSTRITANHLAAVGLAWIGLFFVLPVVFLIPESIALQTSEPLQHYQRAFKGIFIDLYIRSIIYAVITTVATLTLGYILSFYLAFHSKRVRILLALIVVPLWIAYIVRYFGLVLFFSPAGPFVDLFGLEIDILFTDMAVILGLANVYLPFAVLPIYNSLKAINPEIIDSSRVLGAGNLRTIRSVIFPLSLPGVVASGLIVFILAAGSFLGPAVLGGPQQEMIANAIAGAYLENFNIGFAAALATIFTVLLVVLLLVFNSVFDLQEALGNL